MGNEMLATMYELWIESEEYHSESAIESVTFKEKREETANVAGDEKIGYISDNITNLACDVEAAAFEQGFRRGILFMAEMAKGGVCHA